MKGAKWLPYRKALITVAVVVGVAWWALRALTQMFMPLTAGPMSPVEIVFHNRLKAAAASLRYVIPLRDLTDFYWVKACPFAPYLSPTDVTQKVGHAPPNENWIWSISWSEEPYIGTIIFVRPSGDFVPVRIGAHHFDNDKNHLRQTPCLERDGGAFEMQMQPPAEMPDRILLRFVTTPIELSK
jgi:hypothetical protein